MASDLLRPLFRYNNIFVHNILDHAMHSSHNFNISETHFYNEPCMIQGFYLAPKGEFYCLVDKDNLQVHFTPALPATLTSACFCKPKPTQNFDHTKFPSKQFNYLI